MDGEERVPDAVEVSAQENICPSTAGGWLWYCDLHDTHGNADREDEANVMASAHEDYWDDVGADGDEDCDVVVWRRTGHERIGGGG